MNCILLETFQEIINGKYMSSNIFFLIGELNGGGAQRIVVSLSDSIENSKLVTIWDTPSKYASQLNRHPLSSYSHKRVVRVLKMPLIFLKYLQLLRKDSPKICFSALAVDNLYNILSSVLTKIPAVIAVHGMPSYTSSNMNSVITSTVFLLAKKTKTQVIAVSNGVRDELIQLHGLSESQISVIYNPIDISTIQELAKEEELDSRVDTTVPLIVTAGRLSFEKGQWHLIRAFAEVRKKQECQLLICGEGPEKEYLAGLIRDLGIEDDVVFLGWQENPYKYMKKSTLFVQSSLSEALPNVLVESMACGCPVVVARCSRGIEEILGSDDRCGFIVGKMSGSRYPALDDLDVGELDLYNAMLKILEDVPLRADMSETCKERAKMFDLDIGIQKYVELIEDVCASR